MHFCSKMVYFMNMQPQLSIIIVNYRSEDVLVDCLRSLHVATKRNIEVILVDNSIGREADDVLRESGLSSQYFPQAENVGYTRAANFGAQHARGELLCFLNPDMIMNAHAIDRMAEFVEQHPLVVAGPRELNAAGQIVTTVFPRVTRRYVWGANLLYKLPWARWIQPLMGWLIPPFRYAHLCRTATRPTRVPVLSGGCVMLLRSTWDIVGEWNPKLTYFGLESEWFTRARENGVSAWYVPDATIYHEHGLSIRRAPNAEVRNEADRNRYWHAKQLGWFAVVMLGVTLWIEYRIRPNR
jgi:GT2 family glycosyltransferase